MTEVQPSIVQSLLSGLLGCDLLDSGIGPIIDSGIGYGIARDLLGT